MIPCSHILNSVQVSCKASPVFTIFCRLIKDDGNPNGSDTHAIYNVGCMDEVNCHERNYICIFSLD